MRNTFLVSDPHFGHNNICRFLRPDGTKVRPWSDAAEMDEALVQNWNRVVGPHDKVYVLGDVAMRREHIGTIARCNGRKRLIRGNHDIFRTRDYLEHFDEIYGVRVLDDMILSHYPLHPGSVNRPTNVHGHLHHNDIDDGLYYNICVENIGYTPIAIEDLRCLIAVKKALWPTEIQHTS